MLLPTVLIIGKTISKRDQRLVQVALPENHYILRQRSKWKSKDVFNHVIGAIAWGLRGELATSEIVLEMECLPFRYSSEVLLAARSAKIHISLTLSLIHI